MAAAAYFFADPGLPATTSPATAASASVTPSAKMSRRVPMTGIRTNDVRSVPTMLPVVDRE